MRRLVNRGVSCNGGTGKISRAEMCEYGDAERQVSRNLYRIGRDMVRVGSFLRDFRGVHAWKIGHCIVGSI